MGASSQIVFTCWPHVIFGSCSSKFVNGVRLPDNICTLQRHTIFKFLFSNRFWVMGPYKRTSADSAFITVAQITIMGNITTHDGSCNFIECQMNKLSQFTCGFFMISTEKLDTFKNWHIAEIISRNQLLPQVWKTTAFKDDVIVVVLFVTNHF